MDSYRYLAAGYDALTQDVGYERRADFIEKLMHRAAIPVRTVLDLACGTGTLTEIFARRGYEMIGVDGSEEMLMQAREKFFGFEGVQPLLLHQSMPQLDLYGTVDAAVCCLDSINYLTSPREVQRTFARLRLFIAPGGSFTFDVHGIAKMEALDGEVFLDEDEDVYCVWRTEYRKRAKMLDYYVDIFRREGETWERGFEEHHQRAYSVEELTAWLEAAGFGKIRTYGDCAMRSAKENEGRIYFSCIRK